MFYFDKNYEKCYGKIRDWFSAKTKRVQIFAAVYRYVPLAVAGSYVLCLILSFLKEWGLFWQNLIGPAGLFMTISILRYCMDFPRPYEKEKVEPLIQKKKKGQSFPSRHAASASVIAMAWMNLSVPFGVVALSFALIVAASRVCAGVHYLRDVVIGSLSGIVVGILMLVL